MASHTNQLIVGLAAAVGTALLVFARKHGGDIDPELQPVRSDDAIDRALTEYRAWFGLKETDPRAAPMLARYWAAVGLPPQPTATPWSAAFISFVAGVPALQPSANHLGYARAAWKARQSANLGRYWAFDPREPSERLPPRRGDILIKGRGQPVGWADVVNDTGHKDSHGDLVIDDAGDQLMLMGGNVSDGVTASQTSFALPGVFALLRRVDTPADVLALRNSGGTLV